MRVWNRSSAVLLVALALLIAIKTERLLGEEREMDSQVLAEVSTQLAKEDRFQNLTVEVEDRTVRLRGSVAVLEDKRQALQKVIETNGVGIVINHIRVETERIPDGLLLRQLRERLADPKQPYQA